MFCKKISSFFALSKLFGRLREDKAFIQPPNISDSQDMIFQFNNLSNQLNTDELTKLFNRRCFFNDINKKIENSDCKDPQNNFFIMFIDLDGFKTINDELGHFAGDEVLCEYSNRLKNHPIAQKSTIYRMGGDEFVLLFENEQHNSPLQVRDIMKLSAEILQITDEPFSIKEKKRRLSQSIGVANYQDCITPEEILLYADIAMYEAKRLGKSRSVFYSSELHSKVKGRNEIIRLLKHAIENDEFHLVFQPKMVKGVNGYEKKGAEVLMRWENSTLGVVSPQIFIPIAEEAGLMGMIDNWLIEESAKQIQTMMKIGIKPLFSINISAKQFSNINLPDNFYNTLKKYEISPTSIIIEITESATIKEPELAKAILRRFRQHGFGISVDDFGTGYSSIGYLRQFPITEIKFDRSFTKNINIDEQDEIIISGLSNIAQQLHLDIVMEGIETEKQIKWIEKNIPTAIIQGYFFSKPLKINDFITFSQQIKGYVPQIIADAIN